MANPTRQKGNGTSPPVNVARLYWEIGFRVRVMRETRELSQQQLAKKCGLSRASIANLESGRQRSPVHVFYEVASALGVKPTQLFPAMTAVTEIR
jgi:transcriptional regulator with XRE-family HTH domain